MPYQQKKQKGDYEPGGRGGAPDPHLVNCKACLSQSCVISTIWISKCLVKPCRKCAADQDKVLIGAWFLVFLMNFFNEPYMYLLNEKLLHFAVPSWLWHLSGGTNTVVRWFLSMYGNLFPHLNVSCTRCYKFINYLPSVIVQGRSGELGLLNTAAGITAKKKWQHDMLHYIIGKQFEK